MLQVLKPQVQVQVPSTTSLVCTSRWMTSTYVNHYPKQFWNRNFYQPDTLNIDPEKQLWCGKPRVSKHWRQKYNIIKVIKIKLN